MRRDDTEQFLVGVGLFAASRVAFCMHSLDAMDAMDGVDGMDAMDADELIAFLCDVDASGLPAGEWLLPTDMDASVMPPLPPSSGIPPLPSADKDAGHADSDDSSHDSFHSIATERGLVHASAPPKRRTRKQELAALRDQVGQMTHQLHALKLAAGIGISTPVAAIPRSQLQALTAATAATAALGCRLWEKLAAKQLKRRREAEHENLALRGAVEVHARRAKKLRQMLHRRAENEQRAIQDLFSKSNGVSFISLPDDEYVFQRLAKGMDEANATIDTTLRDAKMHELPVPSRRHSGQGLGCGKWRVVLRSVHAVPFEFEKTEQAAWVYFSKATDNNENELRSSIRFTFSRPNEGALVMNQRAVTRRYRERKRLVVVNRSLTEPMPGISIETTKLIVFTSGERTVTGPTSVIQTYLVALGSATNEFLSSVGAEVLRRSSEHATETDDSSFGLKDWVASIDRDMNEIEDVLVSGDF